MANLLNLTDLPMANLLSIITLQPRPQGEGGSISGLKSLYQTCTALRDAVLAHAPCLKLQSDTSLAKNARCFRVLATRSADLHLVWVLGSWWSLETPHASMCDAIWSGTPWNCVKKLSIQTSYTGGANANEPSADIALPFSSACPNLTSLQLRSGPHISGLSFFSSLSGCKQFTALDVRDAAISRLSRTAWRLLPGMLPGLRSLVISNCAGHKELLRAFRSQLTELDAWRADTHVQHVRRAVSKAPKLQRLRLPQTARLREQDTLGQHWLDVLVPHPSLRSIRAYQVGLVPASHAQSACSWEELTLDLDAWEPTMTPHALSRLPLGGLQRLVLPCLHLPLRSNTTAFDAEVAAAVQQLARPRSLGWCGIDTLLAEAPVYASMLTLQFVEGGHGNADSRSLLAARLSRLAPFTPYLSSGLRLENTVFCGTRCLSPPHLQALDSSFGPALTTLSASPHLPFSHRCYRELHTLLPGLRALQVNLSPHQLRLLAQHHPGPLSLLVGPKFERAAARVLHELAAAGAQPRIAVKDEHGWPLPPYQPVTGHEAAGGADGDDLVLPGSSGPGPEGIEDDGGGAGAEAWGAALEEPEDGVARTDDAGLVTWSDEPTPNAAALNMLGLPSFLGLTDSEDDGA